MLDTLGNLGDFLGGVGVLVSLVYLAVQVRQNTTASRTNSYQEAVAALNDWSCEIGSSTELCELVAAGSADYSGLSPTDRMKFNLLMSAYFRNMENIHAKFMSETISEDVWGGWAIRLRAFMRTPGVTEWWRLNEAAFAKDFRAHLRTDLPGEERAEGPGDFVIASPTTDSEI